LLKEKRSSGVERAQVDLAGSEALPRGDSNETRQREAKATAGSLAALSKALLALQEGEPGVGVPYGDSKLTHLLKDSLGRGSKVRSLSLSRVESDSLCH